MRIKFTRFAECTWDRFINVARGGRRVSLAPSFLLTNEMGATFGVAEEITREKWAKVVFQLPAGKAGAATLLWYVDAVADPDKRAAHIFVNGNRILHRLDPEKMLTGGWDRHQIPARYLRPGRNEIVFASHGRLRVDPGEENASFRSFDRGRTWHRNAFGPKNDLAGEYMVRLRVKGYPAEGRITSPVMDLGDPHDKGRIVPQMSVKSVRLITHERLPKGTGISCEMRSGSTPTFDPTCWTPWRRTRRLRRPSRFLQWRAALKTSRTEATPLLTGVTVEAQVNAPKAGPDRYRVIEWERPVLHRSSYPFTYLAPHPRAERLVKQYRLNEVAPPDRSEFERLAMLRDWVHRQWYGWQGNRYPYCPSWDPLEILDTTKNNWGFGMCTHFAATFVGCAAALGYAARVIIIDHHCLAEVWIHELRKWICMDAGPGRGRHAMYELDGKPVNALEIHEAIARGRAADLRERVFPQNRIRPMRKNLVNIFCRFGIPLRNNHLIQPEPAEAAHGAHQYHWDGYLWWTDEAVPKYPEYSLQTRRPADIYWTVGLVRIHLQIGARPGHLLVNLEQTMPNFDRYLICVNGKDWQPAGDQVEWKLVKGVNVLEAKAVNAFGHEGPPVSVKVHRDRCRGSSE